MNKTILNEKLFFVQKYSLLLFYSFERIKIIYEAWMF
jgi:hypothetical protein